MNKKNFDVASKDSLLRCQNDLKVVLDKTNTRLVVSVTPLNRFTRLFLRFIKVGSVIVIIKR